ncbi:hypothetical protein [Kibdelosporangium philippinense]|uniref:hypothetical protein n=1 Tax=Kibdelosporangium philippinense TaxID=211113 RepID=UPI003616EAA4
MRAGIGAVPGVAAATPRILVVFGRCRGGARGRIRPRYRDRGSRNAALAAISRDACVRCLLATR